MKAIALLCLAITLASCGTIRKHTNKQESSSQTTQQVDTKTTTTIREKVDTNVTVSGATSSLSAPIDQVLSGDTIRAKQGAATLSLHFDRQTRELIAEAKVEPISVPVRIDRETTINQVQESSTQQEVTNKAKQVSTEREAFPWWLVALCGALLLVLLFLINRFIPRF